MDYTDFSYDSDYNGNYGYSDVPQQQRKYSKAEVKQGLMDFLYEHNINISKVEMIEDEPNVLRHACEPEGISGLGTNEFQVVQPYSTVQVKYWCCPSCGKLYISKFSLDSV